MSLYNELKRRNVFRVAIAYLAGAWLLIEVTETLFPIYGFSDEAIRLVVTLLAIGFPILLTFSWVFELTPEGLKLEKDIDPSVSLTHHTSKTLDRTIIVLLALALGYFAFDKFVLDPARDAELVEETAQQTRSDVLVESYGDKSIAVLPFVNMSSDPDQEYFSEGMSEELLNLLAKIPGLHVISRSSSFTFKGKDFDIPTIAEQLGVSYILEGSVRKAGNQVRITAQLIEARSDTHMWSETYDRELENILVMQDDISAAIVGVLREQLGLQIEMASRAITTTNIEAYDAYLRGRHLVVQQTQAAVESAIGEFEKAIALDTGYALAHAELAIATLSLASSYNLTDPEGNAMERAVPHAEWAIALDPNLAEAHAAAGFLLWGQEKSEVALTHFERAIQINPNYAYVHLLLGKLLNRDFGLYARAMESLGTAVGLNPLSVEALGNHGLALIESNRLDEADRHMENIALMAPDLHAVQRSLRTALGGQWAKLILNYLDRLRMNPEKLVTRKDLTSTFAAIGLEKEAFAISGWYRSFVQSMLGRPAEAVARLETWLAKNPDSIYIRYIQRQLGLALASAGDYARARPILEEMWQDSGKRVTASGLFQIDAAAALIAIRREAGEAAGVDELVAGIRDNARRYREAGMIGTGLTGPPFLIFDADYEEGLAAYLAGERKRGLVLIASAVERGFFILPNEAYLQVLYDDPGFAPIRASQKARQTRERNKFLAIVCTDNPYEAVWQPAEGTCERFATEGGN